MEIEIRNEAIEPNDLQERGELLFFNELENCEEPDGHTWSAEYLLSYEGIEEIFE